MDGERLGEVAAELGFWPATTDAADIERRPQHNQVGGHWSSRTRVTSFTACIEVGRLPGRNLRVQANDHRVERDPILEQYVRDLELLATS
jgi:hypothetical protein